MTADRRPPRPATRRSPAPPGGRQPSAPVVLYGWHPVAAALANPQRRITRLLATENALVRLRSAALLPVPEPIPVRADAITRLLGPEAVHQGLYAEAEPLPAPDLDDLPADALLLALDQVTDPHNVGAILRSAAAFGVAALVTTLRHSPAATGVLAKAASGALEHVPILAVRNLAETLIAMGENGTFRVGLDSSGGVELGAVPMRRPAVLVLGAEGKGLRQRTRECCDVVARLDLPGVIKSLNVSNAAAVALYALRAGADRKAVEKA